MLHSIITLVRTCQSPESVVVDVRAGLSDLPRHVRDGRARPLHGPRHSHSRLTLSISSFGYPSGDSHVGSQDSGFPVLNLVREERPMMIQYSILRFVLHAMIAMAGTLSNISRCPVLSVRGRIF